MSKFVRRWAGWDGSTPSSNTRAETGDQGTSKTCRTPFAGFAGTLPEHLPEISSSPDGHKEGRLATSKTSKTPFAGFAGTLPGDPSENPAALELREEGSTPTSKTSKIPNHEDVAGMDLDTFARAGLIVQVSSRVLGCDVLFASDNVPDAELADTDLPIYRADELRKLALLRPRPRDLRRIQDVKSIFSGSIADVRPGESPRRQQKSIASSRMRREPQVLSHSQV